MSGRRVILLLAVAAGARALASYVWLGAVLEPDTELYAAGGLGLFPSPLGRLIGCGGVELLAAANAGANVLLVLGAAELARARGGRPILAALIALLAPLAAWSIFASVDTIGAACVVWALIALECGHRKRSAGLGALAAGFHLAAILVLAALVVWRARARARLLLPPVAAVGLVLALLTPYRAIVLELRPFTAASSAAATLGVFALTFLPWLLRLELVLPIAAGGAIAAGLVSSSTWETNCRYMLPAVPVAAAAASTRRASS